MEFPMRFKKFWKVMKGHTHYLSDVLKSWFEEQLRTRCPGLWFDESSILSNLRKSPYKIRGNIKSRITEALSAGVESW